MDREHAVKMLAGTLFTQQLSLALIHGQLPIKDDATRRALMRDCARMALELETITEQEIGADDLARIKNA